MFVGVLLSTYVTENKIFTGVKDCVGFSIILEEIGA